jgi:hypothetical protein
MTYCSVTSGLLYARRSESGEEPANGRVMVRPLDLCVYQFFTSVYDCC